MRDRHKFYQMKISSLKFANNKFNDKEKDLIKKFFRRSIIL